MDETLTKEQLDKINKFSRRPLSADELYCFSVILCDNEIDRDCERFSLNALNQLSKMFIGKTGIFDHNPKGSNQTARIYDTCVIEDLSHKTKANEAYTYLKAYAYMIKTEKNNDLIKEIDAGIKKEVSISCKIAEKRCSVCNTLLTDKICSHRKGKLYNGLQCHTVLDKAEDAYEWSFVAIPAQINAGVTKYFDLSSNNKERENNTNNINSDFRENLKKDIIRFSFLTQPDFSVKALSAIIERMTDAELSDLWSLLSKSVMTTEKPQTETISDISCNESFKL